VRISELKLYAVLSAESNNRDSLFHHAQKLLPKKGHSILVGITLFIPLFSSEAHKKMLAQVAIINKHVKTKLGIIQMRKFF